MRVPYAPLFYGWTFAGPPLVIALAEGPLGDMRLLPCALCGTSSAWCQHRVWALVGLHVAGIAVLAWRWRAVAGASAPEESRWRVVLAWLAILLMAVALSFEALVEVRSVTVTGVLVMAVGCPLVYPGGGLGTWVVGWSAIVTPLIGLYLVASLHLSPSAAKVPLFGVGMAGFLLAVLGASSAVLARASRAGPGSGPMVGSAGSRGTRTPGGSTSCSAAISSSPPPS